MVKTNWTGRKKFGWVQNRKDEALDINKTNFLYLPKKTYKTYFVTSSFFFEIMATLMGNFIRL